LDPEVGVPLLQKGFEELVEVGVGVIHLKYPVEEEVGVALLQQLVVLEVV
jgi:hypothetical protein